MVSYSRVGWQYKWKNFLYWFVWAKGILNLFPEIFHLNAEEDKKGERRSGGKYTIS